MHCTDGWWRMGGRLASIKPVKNVSPKTRCGVQSEHEAMLLDVFSCRIDPRLQHLFSTFLVPGPQAYVKAEGREGL